MGQSLISKTSCVNLGDNTLLTSYPINCEGIARNVLKEKVILDCMAKDCMEKKKIYFPVLFFVLFCLTLTGCGLFPESVKMGDPKLKPFSSMYKVNRKALGLSPIPAQADVRIETRSGSDAKRVGYDAMLHIDADTSRTVAFKRNGNSYKWIGEQETYKGPGEYTTIDGTFNEEITITYDTSPVSGAPINTIYITYWGNNPRLTSKSNLTLKDVLPTLKLWQKMKQKTN